MSTELILVDGHSSVGKSSISKSVHQQICQQKGAYWLHEECERHPIRHQEFSFGALDSAEGMELNREGMLTKWAAFRDSIHASGKICVTEGCLLHAYDRYFIHSLWNDEEILKFYLQVIEVIRPLNPIIILLYRPDLKSSLEKAFLARGQWWRDLMLKRDDRHVYFKDHVYVDENSMFRAIEFEQRRILEIFARLPCTKLKIDTSAERWDEYVQEIVAVAGMRTRKIVPYACDLRRYAGKYRWEHEGEAREWVITYDESTESLFTTLFWPYMPMRCVAENVFELISFPVELHFQVENERMQFRVHGNYDWDYNDQIFVRE